MIERNPMQAINLQVLELFGLNKHELLTEARAGKGPPPKGVSILFFHFSNSGGGRGMGGFYFIYFSYVLDLAVADDKGLSSL